MEGADNQSTRDLIQHFRAEAAAYRRQWTLSLGVGCGGAAIALISLAANLPDPNFAFRLLAPSLWLFLLGIIAAAASLPMAAARSESTGTHFAEAFNRASFQSAAHRRPQVMSSPQSIADEMNAPRDKLIEMGDEAHRRAELAWKSRRSLQVALNATLAVSACAFIAGVALPLIYISTGGRLTPSRTPLTIAHPEKHVECRLAQ